MKLQRGPREGGKEVWGIHRTCVPGKQKGPDRGKEGESRRRGEGRGLGAKNQPKRKKTCRMP